MQKIIKKCSDPRTLTQIVASAVLRCGPMPKHVAFIMDGNRRYARGLGQPVIHGHEKGLRHVVEEVTLLVLGLKIPMITLYAFSIENFKRSNEEVEDLMDVFENFFGCMAASVNSGMGKLGVRFQVTGNWDLIPNRLKPYIAKLHYHARENPDSPLLVNIALAYTSRDAMYRSYEAIVDGHEFLTPSDVTEGLFQELHSIFPIPPVDLLIRTGGDTRLSDFMLWESTYAHIEFLDITWPEFTFWELWKTIFRYQAAPRAKDPREWEVLTDKQVEFVSIRRNELLKYMEEAIKAYVAKDDEILELDNNWVKTTFSFVLE